MKRRFNMRILVTNDDSIKSEGLYILAKLAKKYGEVVVVAPKHEQSAKSHAINVTTGLLIEPYDLGLGIEAYTVDSTPADCVRSAVYALNKEFDIVLSGINNGYNVGQDIVYSGTVAAASEGVLEGKRAIAFSIYPHHYQAAIPVFDEIMEFIFKNNFFDHCLLYNVNIPKKSLGIKITKQGNTFFDTRFELVESLYYQRGNPRFHMDQDVDTDVWAIENGYISISPLLVEKTNYEVYNKIKKLNQK